MTGRIWETLLLGLVLLSAGSAPAQRTGLATFGEAGCGSDFVPTLHTAGEMPTLGNSNFRLVFENLKGGAPGLICLSDMPANLPLLGITLNIDPRLGLMIGSHANGPGGLPGSGRAVIPLRIPHDVALAGGKLFVQGLFIDSAFPFSLAASKGLEITIPHSVPAEVAVLRDRSRYQAHFAGATADQADQLGRAIWAANQAVGFSYARTVEFTAGGESHWMVIVLHDMTGLEFSLIPGGSFRMGDMHGTGWIWELPVRQVRISPFLLARRELTQAAWMALMRGNPSKFQHFHQTRNMPVEQVTWERAQEWCLKAGLRLPSEAEWEYACRAGVETCFNFGENLPPTNLNSYAWFYDNSHAQTRAVGSLRPNAFGLHDMHGNVWEWVADHYHFDLKCAPPDNTVREGDPLLRRIIRGGGWNSFPLRCRSPNRYRMYIFLHSPEVGFRPAASL